MTDRQLEYFLAVVKEGNIASAARELYISDAALSQLIRKIENEVGAQLFIRTHKAMQLTNAGREFYEFANSTLQRYQQLQYRFGDREDIRTGDLIVSLSVKRALSILPILMPPYIKEFPEVKIKTIADMQTVEEREKDLLDGKYDFIINSYHSSPKAGELEYREIATERMILYMGEKTDLAKKLLKDGKPPQSVKLEDIAEEQFLLPAQVYGGRFMVDSMFAHIGKKPHLLAQVSPVAVSKSLAESGLFCTLSAEIVKNGQILNPPNNCYAIPIELDGDLEKLGSRPIYLAYRKNQPLVLFQRSFIEMAQSLLSEG